MSCKFYDYPLTGSKESAKPVKPTIRTKIHLQNASIWPCGKTTGPVHAAVNSAHLRHDKNPATCTAGSNMSLQTYNEWIPKLVWFVISLTYIRKYCLLYLSGVTRKCSLKRGRTEKALIRLRGYDPRSLIRNFSCSQTMDSKKLVYSEK